MITKDLGMVTAYAYAVAGGYEGTEAEFEQLMADLAVVVDDFDNFSVNVTTLPAGSSATASYADGVLSLGIPKGDKGDKGNTGETGAPAGFGTVSATVDDSIGTPSVEVTASGADTAKNFAFAFHNLKGEKGDKGDTGEVSEAELTQAFEDFSENGTVANAEQLTTDIKANDQTPYLFRTSGGSVDIGDREYINGIVGGTVAFNQLVKIAGGSSTDRGITATFDSTTGIYTLSGTSTGSYASLFSSFGAIKDRVYLALTDIIANPNNVTIRVCPLNINWGSGNMKKATESISTSVGLTGFSANTDLTGVKLRAIIADLTQMFGSTIADYIYSLEQANAGAGVAWFKKHFPKPYYAYNAGELKSVSGLVSHDTTGFNQWDEEWETDLVINGIGGNIGSKNLIPVIPNASYYFYTGTYSPGGSGVRLEYFDANGVSIGGAVRYAPPYTMPENCHYIKFGIQQNIYGTTYNHDICINLSWDGSRDGEYEPYVKHSYPLDSDLTLRGIPKLDNGNLYYDGDVYEPDGTVTRKYGIVDLGTLTWAYFNPEDHKRFGAPFSSKPSSRNLICTKYQDVGYSAVFNNTAEGISIHTDGSQVAVYDTAYTDAADFKTAMSGVYLVYELATPTTETADPYQQTQIVDDFGTEEFVLSDSVFPVPVGHNTDYPINLKAKVEMMPNSPSGDGDYIVRQTNGVNEYVSIANNATIQDILARLEALEG